MARLLAALHEQELPARALRSQQLVAAVAAGDGPHLALTRLASGTPGDELAALLPLELTGLHWMNRPSALVRAHDKGLALAALAAAGLPVPPTLCLRRDDDTTLESLPGERLVVKPVRGAAGRGVTLDLPRDRALASARAYADLCGPVLVQSQRGEGAELRHFIVGGRVVASMERIPAAPGGRANTTCGATARAADPSPASVDLALAAAAALGLDVAGVDLVFDAQGPCVLEVNACPGLTAIEASTGRDVAGALARHARDTMGLR